MAESRAQRMQVVLSLAQKQEDEVANKLAQYRDQVGKEQTQLVELRDYSAQYLSAQGALREGVLAQDLINYSSFIQRLNEACVEQETKVARMSRQLENLQQQWRVQHQKRKSIEELIQRLKREDSQLADKQLQKELDELSAHQLLRQQSDH